MVRVVISALSEEKAMLGPERHIEAGYQKVVLAGYVVAVEISEGWRWLKADKTIVGPALDYWMGQPVCFSIYLLLSLLAVCSGFLLASWLGGIASLVAAAVVFLFGRVVAARIQA
ncbi:MAG TPA: hypothetical protein VFB93_02990 [Burkholderiales bacterium]|nr:hypothetical protein [Burkholderiales bacterium]